MPKKQPNRPRPKAKAKAKPPAIKRPKPSSTPCFNGLLPEVSPEIMQPTTGSKPSFNRQAGEQPNLNPAREIFRRSQDKIMGLRGPQAQLQGRSTVASFTQKTLFEKLLMEHQDEICRLRKELAAEKEENAELRAKLAASQGPPLKKRKRLGGRLCDFED
jgi:hypothetical protein